MNEKKIKIKNTRISYRAVTLLVQCVQYYYIEKIAHSLSNGV